MKKTLISVLLIVSLLSTALFSVVFAAYSDSKTATGTATVSAFNVTLTTTNGTVELTPAMEEQTLAAMEIAGTPEVDVSITYVATLTITGWNADYFPITFDVDGTDFAIGSTLAAEDALDTDSNGVITDTTELIAVVKRAIEAKSIDPAEKNVALDDQHDSFVKVSWTGTDDTKDNAVPADARIDLTITATVEQK